MTETHFTLSIFIVLLLIASGVAIASKWIRVPYTLLLVIVGLVISPMHFIPSVHISPELILLIFLPALLFEAAWNLKLRELRENLVPILTLAVPGVCVSVGIIGLILHKGAGLPLSSSLLFGAMISATDPVSVLALFRKMDLPRRLTTIVEGESLFNDGTAVVVFHILLGIVAGASMEFSSGLFWDSLREFGQVTFGGIAVGAVIGLLASTVTSYFDDHLLEITFTTIVAYGSYLLADALHVSPVIAVLLAGLVVGNYGRRVGMSPTTQVAVDSFWEYAAFVVNSLVFLLIGLEIQLSALAQSLPSILWAVGTMLLARVAAIYSLMPLTNRYVRAPVPFRWQHVLFWGGLRGSLSIALVLSLPLSLPGRAQLVVMLFGTVIFSLLGQGLTVSSLIRWLRLGQGRPHLDEYELLQGRLLAETAALSELESWQRQGKVTQVTYRELHESLSASQRDIGEKLAALDVTGRDLERHRLDRARRRLVDVKKARISELLREGILSEAVFEKLSESVETEAAAIQEEPLDTPS